MTLPGRDPRRLAPEAGSSGGGGLNDAAKEAKAAGFSDTATPNEQVMACGAGAPPATYEPCDTVSLTLADGKGRSVSCTEPAGVDASLGAEQRDLLRGHDLLIQTRADCFKDDGKLVKDEDKAEITVEGVTSPACPVSEHALTLMTPQGNAGGSTFSWRNGSGNQKLEAAPLAGAGAWARWLEPCWDFSDRRVRRWTVETLSCGIRDSGRPNGSLTGLVEVHPKDDFQLVVKVPPLKSLKKTGAKTWDRKRTVELVRSETRSDARGRDGASSESRESYSRSGDFSRTETRSTTRDGETWRESETAGTRNGDLRYSTTQTLSLRGSGGPGLVRTSTLTESDATDGERDFVSQETLELDPAFSLKRNGVELDVTRAVNDILNLADRLRDAWNAMQNFVPKVGWYAELDIAVLEGEITGTWGFRESAEAAHARIAPIERHYAIKGQVTVVRVDASLAFGLNIKAPGWFSGHLYALIAEAKGKVHGQADLGFEYSNTAEQQTPASFEGTSTAEIGVYGEATLMAVSYKASGSVSGGVKVSGTLRADFEQDPIFELKAQMLELKANVTLTKTTKGRNYNEDFVFLEARPIWEGQFPRLADADGRGRGR